MEDSSKDQAGTQVTVSGGELLIPVTAPSVPGKGELVIDTGSSKQIIPLQFTAQLRPLLAVGIVEGAISLKDFDGSSITDAQGAFEQELNDFAGNDDYTSSGRAAMFLKGKVRGDYLLTLAYDSDKKKASVCSVISSLANIILSMAIHQLKASMRSLLASFMCALIKVARSLCMVI